MLTGVVSGALGVYAMVDAGAARLDIWPFQPAAMLIGAALFGAGIALIGYCPGTGLAGAGEGSRDAMVGLLGMLSGAGVFVAGYDALEPFALALGDFGKQTLADVLGASRWALIGVLLAVVLVVLSRPVSSRLRSAAGARGSSG